MDIWCNNYHYHELTKYKYLLILQHHIMLPYLSFYLSIYLIWNTQLHNIEKPVIELKHIIMLAHIFILILLNSNTTAGLVILMNMYLLKMELKPSCME